MDQSKQGDKTHLRKAFGSQRDALSSVDRQAHSHSICKRLSEVLKDLSYSKNESPLRVGSYQPIRSEVDVLPLVEMAKNCQFSFPKIDGESMNFFEATRFEKGSFSILEPVSDSDSVDSELAVLLIPGLAFDRQGGRLGYGKGFYDRWLQSRSVIKIGVAFGHQLSDQSVNFEKHDVTMDLIVTENFVLGSSKVAQVLERAS